MRNPRLAEVLPTPDALRDWFDRRVWLENHWWKRPIEHRSTPSRSLEAAWALVREFLVAEDILIYGDVDSWQKSVPAHYERVTGRSFWPDFGRPGLMEKTIIKRGEIKSEEEWRTLRNHLTDVDDETLTQRQKEKAERMIASFEGAR